MKEIGIKNYKNPYVDQYVAPYGYHFERNGVNYGRVAWFSNVNGITIEKDDEELNIIVNLEDETDTD